MISYVKLKTLTGDASFTSSTTKEAFKGTTPTSMGFTQLPPTDAAVEEGWVGIGCLKETLVLEFPADAGSSPLKKWRWFNAETREPNSRKYTKGDPFVRLSAEKKHLEMFSLLAYFLLSRMAVMYRDGDSPAALAGRALGEWEQYLGVRAEDPSSLYTGAFGEIYVLKLLISEIGPGVVQDWDGPTGESQDVRVDVGCASAVGVEVKTIGADADSLQINGTDQLASPGMLFAVRLGESDARMYQGSLKSLIAEVERSLSQHPEAREEFTKRLGYLSLDEESEHYNSTRSIAEVEYWDMRDLPRVSVSGPGKENLWPVRSTLRPGPGAKLVAGTKIKPILAGCGASTNGDGTL
jgi:hypothetical protein